MSEFTAKDIILKPIDRKSANAFIIRKHYSGKVVNNTQLHIGVFLPDNKLHGVIQFGPSLDKKKTIGLVRGTKWNEFTEINRLAFDDILPRNSESRAISIALRLIQRQAPNIKWVLSFADATQCGDGTIYRASGFHLTSIKKTFDSYILPNGESFTAITIKLHGYAGGITRYINRQTFNDIIGTKYSSRARISELMQHIGAMPKPGYQLRYIFFIDKTYKDRLTVPILHNNKIYEMGAGMYKGHKVKRGGAGLMVKTPGFQSGNGGSIPTAPLHKTGRVQHAI